jgi:transposase
VRTGHITKQGSKWLRWILTEAVKHAARAPGRYRDLYERLAKRKGRNVARIAVARALLSTTYNVLAHVQ